MADSEGKDPRAGATWSDREKNAVIVLVIEALKGDAGIKWKEIPHPVGRSTIALSRMFDRFRDEAAVDVNKIKAGEPIDVETPKRGRKRKVEEVAKDDDGDNEMSPKPVKKTPRKKAKSKVKVEEEQEEEEDEEEEEV